MSPTLTPLPRPLMPPPAVSTAAAFAVSALRAIRDVTFDRRARDLADRALRELDGGA
jgi:hypothetical protein